MIPASELVIYHDLCNRSYSWSVLRAHSITHMLLMQACLLNMDGGPHKRKACGLLATGDVSIAY